TPGSLAIIQATFAPDDRPKAIGAWSGLGGVAGAVGPFLGGWLIGSGGRRGVFPINLPPPPVGVARPARPVPETREPPHPRRLARGGAILAALALTGITDALIEAPAHGLARAALAGGAGILAGVGFVLLERHRGRAEHGVPPMLPLDVFASRQFNAVNVVTFVIYGALGGTIFLLVLQLQGVAGFTPLAAGVSLLPGAVLLLVLASPAGAAGQRVGPRWLMAGGCLLCAAGLLLAVRIGPNASYVADVLPTVLVFGLGLSAVVAPLTATVLASADVRHAGVASGVNNAVARAAGLLAVAGLPL